MLGMRATAWLRSALADMASDRRAWLVVFLSCLPVYLLTAHYSFVSPDTGDAVLPAWQLVHHGNIWLEHVRPHVVWTVPAAGHHLASNRMPGVELVNVPMVALLYWLGPSWVPGALTAAVLTAATAGFLLLTFRRLTSLRFALIATAVLAFGTSLWSVASTEIFPHTVNAFGISVAMYALSRHRHLLAGLALGATVVARPHMAVVALVLGLGLALVNRSVRPIFLMGVPATLGVAFVIGWNTLVFGHPSINGGYASYVTTNLTNTSAHAAGNMMLSNVLGFLFSPERGLFIFLPLAAVLLLGLPLAWRESPSWIRLLSLAGMAYSLVQLKINRFDGGSSFYGYRLATELVICCAPLGLVAAVSLARAGGWRLRLMRAGAVVSVGLQAVGAIAFNERYTPLVDPWRASGIRIALESRPLLALLLLMVTATACIWALQAQPTGLRIKRERARARQLDPAGELA